MWTLNSTRIFVTKLGYNYKQIIARLHPLGGGTIHHTFGFEGPVNTVTCYIVGATDALALKGITETGISYELMSPYGDMGDYYVSSIQQEIVPTICQSLRPDLDEDSPVFQLQIELFKDE